MSEVQLEPVDLFIIDKVKAVYSWIKFLEEHGLEVPDFTSQAHSDFRFSASCMLIGKGMSADEAVNHLREVVDTKYSRGEEDPYFVKPPKCVKCTAEGPCVDCKDSPAYSRRKRKEDRFRPKLDD